MCVRKYVECWHPFPDNPTAEKERRTMRGLERSDPHNWSAVYWACRGDILRSPRCGSARISNDNTVRVKNFCNHDRICLGRLKNFHDIYQARLRVYEQSERDRESYAWRCMYMQHLRTAYDEWVSAFENHRGCNGRRNADAEFVALDRAGILPRLVGLSDAIRLRWNPAMVQAPDVGAVRH